VVRLGGELWGRMGTRESGNWSLLPGVRVGSGGGSMKV
jgi:hypothetical protein